MDGKLKVKVESELVDYLSTSSQIRCLNFNCINNLVNYPSEYATCNLKHINIDSVGMCTEKKKKKQKNESIV